MKINYMLWNMLTQVNTAMVLSDKYELAELDIMGNITVDGGSMNGRKKGKNYQSIKGNIALAHDAIKSEYKNDVSVIGNAVITHYAFIRKEYLSDKSNELLDQGKKNTEKYFENNPRVKAALLELMEALKEANEKSAS